MADIKTAYGTANQTITITLASLADGAGRECTAVTNSDGFTDVLLTVQVTTASSGVDTTSGCVEIYAYGSTDGGSSYTDSCTGSDAAKTPINAALLDVMKTNANSTTYVSEPLNLSRAFGGVIPQKWGIIVKNESGAALAATGNAAQWQGIYLTVA